MFTKLLCRLRDRSTKDRKRAVKLMRKSRPTLELLERRELFAGLAIGLQPASEFAGAATGQFGNDVQTDASGNTYVAGFFRNTTDFDPTTSGVAQMTAPKTKSLAYGQDGFLAKYSPDGSFLWARRIGSTSVEQIRSLAVDQNGNAYIAGVFYGTASISGVDVGNVPYSSSVTLSSPSIGKKDISSGFIAMFNYKGDLGWAKQFRGDSTGGESDAYAISLSDSNVFVAGHFLGKVDFNPYSVTAGDTLTSLGGSDVFVAKLGYDGIFQTVTRMGSTGNDDVIDLDVDPLGNAYVSSAVNGTPTVAKIGTAGGVMWTQVMGGRGRDIEVSGSNLFVHGNFSTVAGGTVFGTEIVYGFGATDSFASKLNADNGSYVWTKAFGGVESSFAMGLSVGPDGEIYLSGRFYGTIDLDPGAGTYLLNSASTTDPNGYVARLDSNGSLNGWATRLGPSSAGQCIPTTVTWSTAKGSILITGSYSNDLGAYNAQGSANFGLLNNIQSRLFVVELNPLTGLFPAAPLLTSTGVTARKDHVIDQATFTARDHQKLYSDESTIQDPRELVWMVDGNSSRSRSIRDEAIVDYADEETLSDFTEFKLFRPVLVALKSRDR